VCLSASSGAPWFFLCGLKWEPAETQPLLFRVVSDDGECRNRAEAYELSPNSLRRGACQCEQWYE
jgi:hypothetical protein